MKSYKNIRVIKEADADEYVPEVDDIDDIADGEQEFVDLHTAMTLAHPVAGDNQFKSDKDSVEQKGATTDNADGEDKPVKQGTTGDTKFAQFRDKISKTPARKGDKSQGDSKMETVKEDVTEAMDDKKLAYKQGVSDAKKGKKRANASDVYGPHANEYHKGYDSVKEEVELVKEGMLELVDGEVVDVSDDDADVFNIVLEDLTEENRDLMLIRMHEGVDSYEQMLTFAREHA
tara:strand:- start:155 stop:850 length:696 start_codon:yes stop_codon:yes gene_type:complete